MLLAALASIIAAAPPKTAHLPAHRVFTSTALAIDSILQRPYGPDVPFGASGDRLWATSPQGWGFTEGVQLLYLTNSSLFDPVIYTGGVRYQVEKATYTPSHVHMVGAPGEGPAASASFTYVTDRVENPLSRPFKPEKRWTCWSSGRRDDWYAVDFGRPRLITGIDLYFYDDQPEGGCAPPESVAVEVWRDGDWRSVPTEPLSPRPNRNTITLLQPARCERVRLRFHHRGADKYTGLYGFDPHYAPGDAKLAPPHPAAGTLKVTGDKWITQNDVVVSRISIRNTGKTSQPYYLRMDSDMSGGQDSYTDRHVVGGYPLSLYATAGDGLRRGTRFLGDLAPGQARTFTFACGVSTDAADARSRALALLARPDPLADQVTAYQGWFDSNTAAFVCSDPAVTKMYYHRWYNVKKNSMNPHLGALKHRAFAEGRWTSDWYANVISYGAGHQIREARWLRDPSYSWGALQTWTENERPDGIYPSHITPHGSEGGQYTDWITSTAWDAYLVHPDRNLLTSMADRLAKNVEGWERVYGWDHSPLLAVDSHWWTGMEWQPSFFSFAGYHTGGGSGTDPHDMTPLRRVDLTAYNFGNAQAVARIDRVLGHPAEAARMQDLADKTRNAVLAQMWSPRDHWFHSLRASDFAMSPTEEIIGLYPFYFELPPAGKQYESAWNAATDPFKFWTRWPLASVSRDCPAYSQTGWPVGPGGSGCMWNGPSWPHANSIVMQAMANCLRHYAPSSLTRERFYDLFLSFTRAQYRNGDLRYPWTGEYYNGDTGAWKTDQRDYNHSTWIDPLISDFIGIVPRPDNTLEVDPLLPKGAWSYYALDGQSYRGHDVTVAYDSHGGHIAPGFRGYAVYVDGKRVFSADHPVRCTVPLP